MKDEYSSPVLEVLGELHEVTAASYGAAGSDWFNSGYFGDGEVGSS